MDFDLYLDKFQKAASRLDKKLLNKKQIESATGIVLNSVFLKLYKKSWANKSEDPLRAESRIFFSVWISDSTLKEEKIFYNIHAFKLRKLNGYAIESRKFAETFRMMFKKLEHRWPNVSTTFGPLTLMEGWIKINPDNLQDEILSLANRFLEIDDLIDSALAEFKK
ncbi:MAG TPA: hypothetical protein VKT28_15530 [Puia sp.]|nr:hypothetical protein [Puia sp.]